MSVYYTKEHEWVAVDGDTGTVGISNYAQAQMGDVVFVEAPEVGRALKKGEEAAVVESVKAASELYSPVGGEVIEDNGNLVDNPATVNASPEGDGWFYKVRLAHPEELEDLMDAAAYKTYLQELERA